jgi:tetratricopeptide (TPR) repeat protein
MQEFNQDTGSAGPPASGRFPWQWALVAGVLLVLLIAMFLPRAKKVDQAGDASAKKTQADRWSATATLQTDRSSLRSRKAGPATSAEAIVTNKVNQFVRNRHELLRKWAEHLKIKVPPEFEQYFDVAETGNWDEMHKAFESLLARRKEGGPWNEEMGRLWPLILETDGVAQVAHAWPAQQLLDYGQTVLSSLRPEMVYVGGTDPGRFIPTLFNETSADRHVVLTQNAFADGAYLDYMRFLYSDQLNLGSEADSQRAFQDYTMDALKRLEHDQQFPNEPKQIRPGENVQNTDGRVQVSGQVAVMAINERILQSIMDKNPSASFALEESFALKSTYANATILGPFMELRAQTSLTPEVAAESVAYWNGAAQRLPSNSSDPGADAVLKAYSKMAAAQAALLLDHNYPAQAEANFQIANQLYPSSPEAVYGYTELLVNQGRVNEAISVAQNATKAAPNNNQFRDLLQRLQSSNH